jgi:hypothetical protein
MTGALRAYSCATSRGLQQVGHYYTHASFCTKCTQITYFVDKLCHTAFCAVSWCMCVVQRWTPHMLTVEIAVCARAHVGQLPRNISGTYRATNPRRGAQMSGSIHIRIYIVTNTQNLERQAAPHSLSPQRPMHVSQSSPVKHDYKCTRQRCSRKTSRSTPPGRRWARTTQAGS